MNPPNSQQPPNSVSAPGQPKPSDKGRNLNFDLKELSSKLKKLWQKLSKHLSFLAILAVLIVYIYTVWHIKLLVAAEPTTDQESAAQASTKIPKIDQKAITQIQSLEKSSPEVHSLFNDARKNPFHE